MGLTGKTINSLRVFGDFRLDTVSRVLWFGDDVVDLPPRAVDVLCVLAEHPGEVVSKKDLLEIVWQGSFVEDSNLTHQIYELRKVFREHAAGDLIQTVPRRGYRFVGEILEAFDGGEEIVVERTVTSRALIAEIDGPPQPLTLPPPPGFAKRHAVAVAAVLIVLIASGGFAYWRSSSGAQAAQLKDVRSIAVLPIGTLGAERDESLEMRLTDSLITKLGAIRQFSVRPTSSISRFTGDVDPIDAGRKLEVDAVLIGRTQHENGLVRLNLQMISVATGEQIWAAQIDGESTRMLAFQDAIAERMLASLNLPAEQAAAFEKQPTSNAEAFEEYTKGRYFWNKRTGDGLRLAIVSFENAVRLDPEFAEAYVGLADSYFLLFDYSYDTSAENVRLARENLETAIGLDPQNAEAYATRGLIQTTHDWNWSEGEASFKKAVELAPRSANPRHRYAMLLLKLGRIPEATQHMQEARRLDPTSPSINMNLGVVYYFSRRYAEAAEQLRRSIDLDPSFSSPRWYLARVLWMAGDREGALGEYAVASRLVGFNASTELIERSSADDPVQVVKKMIPLWKDRIGPQGISPHDIAKLYASIGDSEETLNWLQRAYHQRHPWLTWIGVEPEFDFVRSDKRFVSLIKNLGLE